MRPFSPLYFIKENKTRCAVLVGMIFLSFFAYLGGLYVMNPSDSFEKFYSEFYKRSALVGLVAGDDASVEEYEKALEAVRQEEKVQLLDLGWNNYIAIDNVMSFTVGYDSLTFLSVEDFKLYCEVNEITCNFTKLKSGSAVMSRRFADNIGVKLGDELTPEKYSGVYEEYTVYYITEQDTFSSYYIYEDMTVGNEMVLNIGMTSQEFEAFLDDLEETYKVHIFDYDKAMGEVDRAFEFLPKIYIAVLVLVAVIMAVTVNAVFVGVYQNRNFEFAVYRAIGMGKRAITRKIVGELLWLEGIALVGGSVIVFLGLYLLNHLVLYPAGKYLDYVNGVAVGGLLLCNVIIMIPLMLTRCRQMHKADICAY